MTRVLTTERRSSWTPEAKQRRYGEMRRATFLQRLARGPELLVSRRRIVLSTTPAPHVEPHIVSP